MREKTIDELVKADLAKPMEDLRFFRKTIEIVCTKCGDHFNRRRGYIHLNNYCPPCKRVVDKTVEPLVASVRPVVCDFCGRPGTYNDEHVVYCAGHRQPSQRK